MTEKMSELEKKFQYLEKRVALLEKTLKKQPTATEDKPNNQTNFSGLQGGIRFLISKGFLDQPKTSKDIHKQLENEGYYHSVKSVDKSLRIDLLQKQKILARIKEGNIWKYVMRK